MELKALRAQIDAIDNDMLALFVRRMEVVNDIGALKAAAGLPVADPAREAELLARITAQAPTELKAPAGELFTLLLRLSRERQGSAAGEIGYDV
ncbi:MAG: chorismate mutase [Syntrophomonadaceae bacterium]|nr:chorismate mutase [Syntrophomonadaceae bacterium]